MASRAVTVRMDPKKVVSSDPEVRRSEAVDESAVAIRAYELWQERGAPLGSPETDWLRAEEELKSQTKVEAAA